MASLQRMQKTRPSSWFSFFALVVIVVLQSTPQTIAAGRRPKDWAKMSDAEWDEIAAQWDADEDPEDLKTEDQLEYERMMRAKDAGVPTGVC